MEFSKNYFLGGAILLINKPIYWSSFQVVNKVRWLIKSKFNLKKIKVGHAGTLDPLAEGLLIICTGKMTKKILIIAGDPISINSEIIFKSWNKLSPFLKKKIIIISNFELLQAQFKKLKYSIKVKKIYSLNEVADRNILKVINISNMH